MGAVASMMAPRVPAFAFSIVFTAILLFVIIKYPYQKLCMILKWLCLPLLLYIIVPFTVRQDWWQILKNTFVSTLKLNNRFLSIVVALLGTTISPYLFFWQATMEAEDSTQRKKIILNKRKLSDMKGDVNFGMLLSNVVMLFIILTSGSVLFNAGIRKINTVDQAAKALEPLTGKLTYLMFTIGITGTGFLAIPVLAGSLSYMISETFKWKEGLDKKFSKANAFYITIIVSLLVGLSLDLIGINPIEALVYTAILYGITAPVLIAVIMHIGNNKAVLKEYTNSNLSNFPGGLTLLLMTAAAAALVYLQIHYPVH